MLQVFIALSRTVHVVYTITVVITIIFLLGYLFRTLLFTPYIITVSACINLLTRTNNFRTPPVAETFIISIIPFSVTKTLPCRYRLYCATASGLGRTYVGDLSRHWTHFHKIWLFPEINAFLASS